MLIYSISNHEYDIYMSFSLALISRERNSNGWLNGIAKVAQRKDELWDAIIKSNKTYEDILQYVVEGIDVDKDVNE